MIEQFKSEYFDMLKNSTGYLPWVKNRSYELTRRLFGSNHGCKMCDRHYENHRHLVKRILEQNVCETEMVDIFFKSLIRAEQRFLSRFVPQRSNEERLTGHLVSEMAAAIDLAKPYFKEASLKRYEISKQIDFFYYDTSKGGKLEKKTGADLALTILVDLPDFPKLYKTIIFQAKKIHGSASIDIEQFETLKKYNNGAWAYLFYDCNLSTLQSPFVKMGYDLDYKYVKAKEEGHESFTFSDVFSGLPLSLFLCFELMSDGIGINQINKEHALDFSKSIVGMETNYNIDGYSGVVSLGSGTFKYSSNNNNESYNLTLD